jgi:hypothetical protein
MHRWENVLKYLYIIELPNWTGDRECPWCQELKVFSREVDAPFEEPEWFSNRRDNLMHGNKEGISIDPLFLLPNIKRGIAGASSPIVDKGSSEMQVLFLLATGLQKLRNTDDKPLGRGVLHRYVLSMYNQDDIQSTFQRYSEAMFQAAFLRTVRNDEWDRHAKTKGVKYLADHARQKSRDIILGESILYLHRAGYSGHLPEGFKKALMQWNDVAVDALVKRFKLAAND